MFQHKCTETEQMNIQTSFSPSHGKEIRLGGLGIKLLECVSFCSGKALHQRHTPFWIPSQVHGQICQMKKSPDGRLFHYPSFQHICPLLPACGLPVFISERNDLRCNVQRSSAPYVSRYGALYSEISPLFGICLPVRRETSLPDVQEVRSLKVWDTAQVNPLVFYNQSPSAVTSSKTSLRYCSTKSWPSHTHPF